MKIDWPQIELLTAKIGEAVLQNDTVLEQAYFGDLSRHVTGCYFDEGCRDWRLLETLGDFSPDPHEAICYLLESLEIARHLDAGANSVRISLATNYCYELEDFGAAQDILEGVDEYELSVEDQMVFKDIQDRIRQKKSNDEEKVPGAKNE